MFQLVMVNQSESILLLNDLHVRSPAPSPKNSAAFLEVKEPQQNAEPSKSAAR
jgi:hypothetical protein